MPLLWANQPGKALGAAKGDGSNVAFSPVVPKEKEWWRDKVLYRGYIRGDVNRLGYVIRDSDGTVDIIMDDSPMEWLVTLTSEVTIVGG